MRNLFLLLFSISSSAVMAQLAVKQLASSSESVNSIRSNAIQQATLPFWDDFSITTDGSPDMLRIWGSDTIRQWGDSTRGVYVNSTLAINPPSYKVATLDGLDSNGQIYAQGRGLTDQLYSDSLDLSSFSDNDGIYISFYWACFSPSDTPSKRFAALLAA